MLMYGMWLGKYFTMIKRNAENPKNLKNQALANTVTEGRQLTHKSMYTILYINMYIHKLYLP